MVEAARRRVRSREDMTPEEIALVEERISDNVVILNSIGMRKIHPEERSHRKHPLAPSYAATLRVSNYRQMPTRCDCCGSKNIACSHHVAVYGMEFSEWPWLLRCLDCDARVGLHPFTNIPLGTMADQALRRARMDAKKAFQYRKQVRHWSTNEAYAWLARHMGIKPEECHFGWFDLKQCEMAERLSKARGRKEVMIVRKSYAERSEK